MFSCKLRELIRQAFVRQFAIRLTLSAHTLLSIINHDEIRVHDSVIHHLTPCVAITPRPTTSSLIERRATSALDASTPATQAPSAAVTEKDHVKSVTKITNRFGSSCYPPLCNAKTTGVGRIM